MSLKRMSLKNPGVLIWLAVGASLALTLWKIHFSPLINTDAILYLVATEQLLAAGLAESLSVYNWPFFQIAIAAIHQLTGLELLTAGRILMAACFILLVVAYGRVVRVLGGDGKTLGFALLLILCHTAINDFRDSLVRDPGMIAFVLLALAEQLRFAETGRWRHALLWAFCIGVAFLFRVEALALAVAAPLAMLWVNEYPPKARLRLAARLYTVPVAAVCAAVTISLALPAQLGDRIKLHSDLHFFRENLGDLAIKIDNFSQVISTEILAEFSHRDATLAFVAVIATITLANLARALTLPYLVALILSRFWPARATERRQRLIISWYALIVFAYLFSFALFARFSLTRYSLLLALLLLLPLPFYLRDWWERAPRRTLARGLIVFMFVANGADSLISSDWKKAYIRDAARWARESPAIAADRLVTNEPYLSYFSGKADREMVVRAINPGRAQLRERRDLYWLAGYSYGFRVRQGEEARHLEEEIFRADGKILRVFNGADGRSLYLFTVARDVPRSPLFSGRP